MPGVGVLLPNPHSSHLSFIMWQAFCLWASITIPVQLETIDRGHCVLLLLDQKLRSHISAWKGKPGHQGGHKMYFSALHFWGWPILQTWSPGDQETTSASPSWLDSLWEHLWLLMMPRPNTRAAGTSVVAEDPSTPPTPVLHTMPWAQASPRVLENSGGGALFLSDTEHCACTSLSPIRTHLFQGTSTPSTKSLNVHQAA